MSPRLPRVTAAELRRALREEFRQTGSHLHLGHPTKVGRVTVPVHAREMIKPAVLSSILDQAGITADDLRDLL